MSAPGVLFLPGFMQHADSWSGVAGAVAERYPVKVLDFETWTFEERLAELLMALDGDDVVVGYSMGGRLALQFAVRAYGSVGRNAPAPFAALVLIGASAGIEDPDARATRRAADEELAAWIERHSIEDVVDRWERNPVFGTQEASLVAAQRAGRLRHDPHELARLLRSAGQGACEPVWDRLGRLDMPVVAVAGSHDVDYAAAAERIAAAVPRGSVQIVDGVGHAVHLERPDAVTALLLQLLDEHFGDRFVADVDT
jgi:2-succinyl-6-hydroxy-2,4-cyclohexadiene-1-carboxylate synthase